MVAVPVPDSAHSPRPWSPSPAFGPLRVHARCISLKGDKAEIGRELPLREMTSAACGVGRDSVAGALAEGSLPAFFGASRLREGCLLKKAGPGTPVRAQFHLPSVALCPILELED
ncbi:MAG: hypothetical protein KAJ78_07035 [Acidobacteria bacterium]|nr:hypothetical protein [Acidobacteriota bacterium]